MADSPPTTVSGITVTAPPKAPATSGIPTFKPAINVILAKNIGRSTVGGTVGVSQRFAGAKRAIDLTPYLGDNGMVTTSRSTRQAAGMWSVTLADRMEPDQQESLYGLIEPLDVIQIRMARDSSKYVGQETNNMPIVMRGFVTDVRRETAMTATGPRRTVVISGQDYGKILEIFRIIYLPGYVVGQDLLTAYNLYLNYGVNATANQSAAAFVQGVMDDAVTPFINKMISASGAAGQSKTPVQTIATDISVTKGIVSPFGVQAFDGGSAYDLMKYFGDVGPWNELFIEDRQDGPYLVFRPTPFKDLTGAMIQGGTAPVTHEIFDREIMDLNVTRSDSDVANYYWVGAARTSLIGPEDNQLQAQGRTPSPFVNDYPNCSPSFYGNRLMKIDTQETGRSDGQAEADYNAGIQDAMTFLDDRRDALIKQNRDNIVLEAGTLQMRGNEVITHGCYVNLVRGPGDKGSFEAEAYAHTVTHQFSPMHSFITSISFDRGMGFAKRIQREGGVSSPYLSELNLGGSYGR